MKTKVSKRIISLVMTLSMLFTFFTAVNVSAADDGILVNLDMNNVTAENYSTYKIEPWSSTVSVFDKGNGDMYIRSVPTGGGNGSTYLAIQFDEEVKSDILTISYDLKGKDTYVYGTTAIWLSAGSINDKVDINSVTLPKTSWNKYTQEVNLNTGEVKTYLNGAFVDTVTYDGLKGFNPGYIGFSKYIYTDELNVDNVKVQEGLNGTFADFDMNTESNSIKKLDGNGFTYEPYETDGTDKYMSMHGITSFSLDKALDGNSTIIISFEMSVKERWHAAQFWIGSHTNHVFSFDTTGDSNVWNWMPKTPANITPYKVKLNLATGEAVYYKNEKQIHTATIEAVKGSKATEIGFNMSSALLYLDNLKVEIAPATLKTAEFTNAKTMVLTYDGEMSSKGITVTDSTGAAASCTAVLENGALTVTADSYFTAGETYTVTAKDIYGNAVSTSLVQNAGTFASFDMSSSANIGTFGSSLTVPDDNGGLTFSGYNLMFKLDRAVSNGTIIAEFDLKMDKNDSGSISLNLDTDGSSSTYSECTLHSWSGSAADWAKYKAVINLDGGNGALYKDGAKVSDLTFTLAEGAKIYAIDFFKWGSSNIYLDNLTVTRPAVNISWTKAYSEDNGAWVEDIVNNIPTFVLAAFDGNVLDVTATDGYTASISGKNVYVRPENGYFPAGTTTLTLNWVDEYGFTGTKTITVNASDVYAKCNGISIDGTTAKASFRLLKNKAELDKVEYILASYKDKMLVNAELVEETYDVAADETKPLTLDISGGYDEIRAFMWDGNLVPLTGVTTNP